MRKINSPKRCPLLKKLTHKILYYEFSSLLNYYYKKHYAELLKYASLVTNSF